jgi:hypothetical protein
MKTQIKLAVLALFLAFGFQPSAFSQGPLTPPGAPALITLIL